MIAPAKLEKSEVESINARVWPKIADVAARAKDNVKFHRDAYHESQKAIGSAMREYRMMAQVGLREMARKAGLSPGYVSKLEHGTKPWHERVVKRYLDALTLPPEKPRRFRKGRRKPGRRKGRQAP